MGQLDIGLDSVYGYFIDPINELCAYSCSVESDGTFEWGVDKKEGNGVPATLRTYTFKPGDSRGYVSVKEVDSDPVRKIIINPGQICAAVGVQLKRLSVPKQKPS